MTMETLRISKTANSRSVWTSAPFGYLRCRYCLIFFKRIPWHDCVSNCMGCASKTWNLLFAYFLKTFLNLLYLFSQLGGKWIHVQWRPLCQTLLPIWKRVYFKRYGFAPKERRFTFKGDHFRWCFIWRNVNRKSQKLSLFFRLAKTLFMKCIESPKIA